MKHNEPIKKRNSSAPSEKAHVNYLYYGILFGLLVLVHMYHILLIEGGTAFTKLFYITYSFGQCFIEMVLFSFCGALIKKGAPKFVSYIYVLLVFLVFLSQVVDFPLIRIMDMSIWYSLSFVAQESLANLVEMVKASHISIKIWSLGTCAIIIVLGSACTLFYYTERWVLKKPLSCSYRVLGRMTCFSFLLLGLWDVSTRGLSNSLFGNNYQKALPWKSTFFPHPQNTLAMTGPLKPVPNEKEMMAKIDLVIKPVEKKPNIYLFVVESLREDYIDINNAPFISQFRDQNLSFDLALANANCTHKSWFSLFHSKQAFYWHQMQLNNWQSGSPALKILKKMGYDIRVYSASRLQYYQMDDLLFAKNKSLTDYFYCSAEDNDVPWQCDLNVFKKVNDDMNNPDLQSGNVFIIFLDSTHFDYSWPSEEQTLFTPIINEINYLKVAFSHHDVDFIKNRYRNALYYVDSLFGQFLTNLKKTPNWDESIVVLCGDHGEEFFEEGRLFHASNLNNPQTHIALYYKIGLNETKPECSMTSHIDILPSIIQYVSNDRAYKEFLEGDSIFNKDKSPYVITARYNASRNPYEFCIHNGISRLSLRFCNETEIFNCQKLHILSERDINDQFLPFSIKDAQLRFGDALDQLFMPKPPSKI
ncbi:MAG: sulfatase-like hydrolase/transferase [Parachlamydiales bacterium]|nr:sulfatase-like hydrolase/transferase [Parachlamydiales bacterium]